jgi:aerobic-type carbon monoxide dehydrogenase small subunit (CoxS/CutS family)
MNEARAAEDSAKVVGPGTVGITLKINGQEKQVQIEPRTTLAEALRDYLDLTGTKVVCDRGSCSACTVMLDDVAICSCMTLAIDVGSRAIKTIEGLALGDQLHAVQSAFIARDGMQCGFCTPGMVMSCAALLDKNPNPTVEEIRQGISGNLCRCGTYPKVIEAVLLAKEAQNVPAKS